MKKVSVVLVGVFAAMMFGACAKSADEDVAASSDVVTIEQSSEAALKESSEAASEKSSEVVSESSQPVETQMVDVSVSDSSDFVIEGGVLTAYTGDASYVVIPDGVTQIAEGAFWSNEFMEAVEVPASVEEVGGIAFWSCPALRYVHFEEGLEKLGEAAFWSCDSLSDVNLPASVTDISWDSFANCYAITLHVIEGSAAEEFAKTEEIPYDYTYAGFTPNTGKIIRPSEYEYGEFEEFVIEDDVTAIGACAFQYCNNLKNIDIPGSVKSIGGDAFAYCESLETVNIGDGCTEIGYNSFAYCTGLSDVTMTASVTKIAEFAFYCCDDLVIHCPVGSYAEQYAMENGISYDNRVE